MLVYKGVFGPESGKQVPADEALEYAMKECGIQVAPGAELSPEFAEMLEEWFFSGNWLPEEEDE